jgi:ribonuclease Z
MRAANRRSAIIAFASAIFAMLSSSVSTLAQEKAAEPQIAVHLLGTGAPIPRMDRFGPATLISIAGKRLLFDAGRGVSQRLWQLGIPLGSIDAVFLTHLHSDHLVGLPDLWLTGWLQPEYGRRQTALRIIGPKGTATFADSMKGGFEPDIIYRSGKEGLPLSGISINAQEIDGEQIVYQEQGIIVRAFEVDHGAVKPAYGFRIEYAGKKIIISGDTRFNENLIRNAENADVLIHEVVSAAVPLRETPFVQRQYGYHTSPEDLARIFGATKPKMAVLTHFVLLGNVTYPAPTPEDVLKELRDKGYAGPAVAGVDLMRIDIGDSVTVAPPVQKN